MGTSELQVGADASFVRICASDAIVGDWNKWESETPIGLPLDFRDQPHGEQGVAAEIEEMIVMADILPLEESPPDTGEVLLEDRPRPISFLTR